MLNKEMKNLCCLVFPATANNNFVNLFNSIKSDYNLEVLTHSSSDIPKEMTGYNNRLIVFYADKEEDFKKLQDMYNKYSDRWSTYTIILAAPFDATKHRTLFNAKHILDCSDLDSAKRNLVRILDSCCRPSEQVKGERPGFTTTEKKEIIKDVK